MICRSRHVVLGDFIEIQWKKQPLMFVAVVIVFCVFLIDAFFNILNLFEVSSFIKEKINLIDWVSFFTSSFVITIALTLENEVTIMKKNYTWNEKPFIRGAFLFIPVCFSVFFLKKISLLIFY